MSFGNLCFTFLYVVDLIWKTNLGTCMVELIKKGEGKD